MIATASTYAVIIVLEALGFIVWNVGSRAPWAVIRDVIAGLKSPRVFRRSIGPFVLGGACLVLAYALLTVRLPVRGTTQYLVVLLIVLAGLAVEMLLGDVLRPPARGARN